MPFTFHLAIFLCIMALPLSAVSAMAKGKFGSIGTFGHFERIGGFSKYLASGIVLAAFALFVSSSVVLPALLVTSAAYAVAGSLMLILTSGSGTPKHSSEETVRRGAPRPASLSKNANRGRLMTCQMLLTIGASTNLLWALISLREII